MLPSPNNDIKTLDVFFFCYDYPPISRTRTRQIFAEQIANAGFHVTVITVLNPSGFLSKPIIENSVQHEHNNLKLVRIKIINWLFIGELLNLLKLTVDPFQNWFWATKRKLRKIIRSDNAIIIALYPPYGNHKLAYIASKISGFPLILDYRDEFLNIIVPSDGFYRERICKLEKKITEHAQLITVASATIKENIIERYKLKEKKVQILFSGYDDTPIESKKEKFNHNVLKIVYAGAFSQHQKPEIIIQAFQKKILNHPEIENKIHIVFYGPNNIYFKYKVKPALTNRIKYGGYIPHNNIASLMSKYDIGFVSLNGEAYKYAIPRKIFDYIYYKIPIIGALPKGEAANFIEKNNIGLVTDYKDIDMLGDVLYKFINSPELIDTFKNNMYKMGDFYSAQKQGENFAELLKNKFIKTIT
jgi:glycosyltransferase involved in cell wall biosynthesis